MSTERAYLDYNATAPLRPEARAAAVSALDAVGNASSVHAEGRRARALVEEARDAVAQLVGSRPEEVVFTSGATEANNWVMRAGWARMLMARHEHDSVLAPARAAAGAATEITVDRGGVVEMKQIERLAADEHAPRTLLSLQLANSETGVIQPVREARTLLASGVIVHSDAVQAVGRIPVDFRALGIDLMSISSHKMGGPKGAGALIIRDGVELPPLLSGGGQERRRRSGTENVAAIAGFGAAARAARQGLVDVAKLAGLRDRLEAGVRGVTPGAVVIGEASPRLPNTSCLALAGDDATTLLIKLDLKGFAVSAGSACSSGKVGSSHVLQAMGIDPSISRGAIRVSIGWATSEDDIERFVAAWTEIHGQHKARSSYQVATTAGMTGIVGALQAAGE